MMTPQDVFDANANTNDLEFANELREEVLLATARYLTDNDVEPGDMTDGTVTLVTDVFRHVAGGDFEDLGFKLVES